MRRWRTSNLGTIVVTDDGGQTEHAPSLSAASAHVLIERVVKPWDALVQQHAERAGLPEHQVFAHVFQESLGSQWAKNKEVPPGLGLMQITSESLYRGHSQQEMLSNPDLNLFIGCNLLAAIAARGNDLAQTASCYNAGSGLDGHPHTSTHNAWGYVCSTGYIDSVVAASNFLIGEVGHEYPPHVPLPDEVVLRMLMSPGMQTIAEALASIGIAPDQWMLPGVGEGAPDTIPAPPGEPES